MKEIEKELVAIHIFHNKVSIHSNGSFVPIVTTLNWHCTGTSVKLAATAFERHHHVSNSILGNGIFEILATELKHL